MKQFIAQRLHEILSPNTYAMYHGSPTKITNFTDEFVGGKEAKDQEGPGIYFTSSAKQAGSYGEYIYTVELSPKKLVSTQNGKAAPASQIEWLIKQAPDWKDTVQNWHENPLQGIKLAVRDVIQYNDSPHQQFQQVWYDFFKYQPILYVRGMVKLGYDATTVIHSESFITDDKNIKHTIVLNPSIIKVVNMDIIKNEK